MPTYHCRPLFLALFAALLMACGSESQRAPENTRPSWPEGLGWRLSDNPLVDIGVLDGDPHYQLFRVTGAMRLSDGRLVVANSGTNELRYYDPSGAYLTSSGRRGGGPGEFGGLSWLGASAEDSTLAYDWQNRRISVFDAEGRFARAFVLRDLSHAPPSHVHPAVLGAGSLLIGTQRFFRDGPLTTGVYHDTIFQLVFDGEGALADTVGRHAGEEFFVAALGEHIDLMPLPFGRSAHTAPWRDGFFFGTGASYEIAYYSRSGDLLRSVRRTHTAAQVTPTHIRRYVEAQLEGVDDQDERTFMENLFAEIPFPEAVPAYHDIQVDADGNLWVQEYPEPGAVQHRWTVFDAEGVMLGEVRTPASLRIYQIGADFVLGRWTDDLDIEHVRLYEIRKGPDAT